MLHYDDLPPLSGTEEEQKRAKIVRSACLRTIQRTQRLLMQEVGLRHRSVHTYHRQTYALQILMCYYRQASWWLLPFPTLEQEFRATWARIMAAPYRMIEGRPRFIFCEEEEDFAQILAPLAPDLICQKMRCSTCGTSIVRSSLKSLWEPAWCGCCLPTEILVPPPKELSLV